MKIDLNTCTSLQLDHAIAKIEGINLDRYGYIEYVIDHLQSEYSLYSPTTEWNDGGPILNKFIANGGEVVRNSFPDANRPDFYFRASTDNWETHQYGRSVLHAVMKTIAAKHYGQYFELEDHLVDYPTEEVVNEVLDMQAFQQTPIKNDVLFDTTTGTTKVFDGTNWVECSISNQGN